LSGLVIPSAVNVKGFNVKTCVLVMG